MLQATHCQNRLCVLPLRVHIHQSALKHGISQTDIAHAWANSVGFFDIDLDEPLKSLCIGPDRAGNLLEILYLQLDDADLIIHAMQLRSAFASYLTGYDS